MPPRPAPNDEKRNLVELILTAGTILGIITAFLHVNPAGEVLFSGTIVLFVIASVRVYSALMKGEITGTSHHRLVVVMLLTFQALLAGLVEAVVLTSAFDQTNVVVVVVYAIFYVAIALIGFKWVFLGVLGVLTDSEKAS